MSSVLLPLLLYLIYTFFSNSGQASALKVAYILKIFWAQSCLYFEGFGLKVA